MNVFFVLILNVNLNRLPIFLYSKSFINFFFLFWFIVCKNVLIKFSSQNRIRLYQLFLWRKNKIKAPIIRINLRTDLAINNFNNHINATKTIYFKKAFDSMFHITYDFYYINTKKCYANLLDVNIRYGLKILFFSTWRKTQILLIWYVHLSKMFYWWNYGISSFLSSFIFNYKFNKFCLSTTNKFQSLKLPTLRYKKHTNLLMYNNSLI